MRPDNMPRPFAPEHSEKKTHVEVLRKMLEAQQGAARSVLSSGLSKDSFVYEHIAGMNTALTAAIKALEAIGNAVAVYQFECDGSWVDCTKEHFEGHDGSEKRILYTHPPKPVVTEQCPACNRAWTEHRMGYSASQCKAKPPKPVVSDERVDVAFKAFHSFVPTNGGTTGFKQQLKAALEVALGVKS